MNFKDDLIECFQVAKIKQLKFVAVKIQMDGFPADEVIINEFDNFDSKLEYYQNTYDEELNHKFAKGISIIDFVYANSFADIEMLLMG